MDNATKLASRIAKNISEAKMANLDQLMGGVEDYAQYRYIQGSVHTLDTVLHFINDEYKKLNKGDGNDEEEGDSTD